MTYDQNNQADCKQEKFDEQLECLRSNLLKAQEQLKTAETGIKAGEEQIKTIEALINKRNQIVEDYREAHPGLKTRQDDFEQAGKDEKNCLENILSAEEQTTICCIVKKEREDITTLDGVIQQYSKDLDGVCNNGERKKLDEKNKDMDKAKKLYELWIDPIKSIESRFKTLETIKKEIDKEHAAGNHAYAYYLLLLSKDSFYYYLDEKPFVVEPECIKDKSVPCLERELKAAWDRYLLADACFNKEVSKVKSLEIKLKTSQAQLAEDKKNLESTIKRRLTNLDDEDCKEEYSPEDKCTNEDSTET